MKLERMVEKRTSALKKSEDRFATVMNSFEALVYVADMKTYEILFCNDYTRKIMGEVEGEICWQVLQKDQRGPLR